MPRKTRKGQKESRTVDARNASQKKAPREQDHVPTDRTHGQVEALRAYGVTDMDICHAIGIGSKATLYRHYRETLAKAKPRRHGQWASELESIAMGRRFNAETGLIEKMDVKPRDRAGVLMFLLSCQARWRRTDRMEHGLPDGAVPPAGGAPIVGAVIMLPDNGRDPRVRKQVARSKLNGSAGHEEPKGTGVKG